MTAPLFWYPGGKRRPARQVWRALGDVQAYAEPFAGSAAVFFARPAWHLGHGKRIEILNDISGRITNMWRALRHDPDTVWQHAQGPRADLDLDARAAALNTADPALAGRLLSDPDWHDAKLAGWQLYTLRYAMHPRLAVNGAARPGRPNPDTPTLTRQDIRDAAQRLRTAQVSLLCGDWSRAVTPRSLRQPHSHEQYLTGVFLDPPYPSGDWQDGIYAAGAASRHPAAECRSWAAGHGADPGCRIVLAGYAADGPPAPGWTALAWTAEGRSPARDQERLWLSPHCLLSAAATATITADPAPLRWEHPATREGA